MTRKILLSQGGYRGYAARAARDEQRMSMSGSRQSPKPKNPKKERVPGWWTGKIVEGKNVRVKVDWDLCMGSGSCVTLAPKVFRLDTRKKKSISDPAPLEVLDEKGTPPETIFLAAQSCPYKAIRLEDSDTGEQLFP